MKPFLIWKFNVNDWQCLTNIDWKQSTKRMFLQFWKKGEMLKTCMLIIEISFRALSRNTETLFSIRVQTSLNVDEFGRNQVFHSSIQFMLCCKSVQSLSETTQTTEPYCHMLGYRSRHAFWYSLVAIWAATPRKLLK